MTIAELLSQPVIAAVLPRALWHRICMEDREIVNRYLHQYPQETSEMTFANLFCWNSVIPYFIGEMQQHLFIGYIGRDKQVRCLPPIGPHPEHFLTSIRAPWAHVGQSLVARLPVGHTFLPDRNQFDYVYSLSELQTLAGRKFHTKRRFINRCEELHPTVLPLNATHRDDCIRVLEGWYSQKEMKEGADRHAITTGLDHFDALGLHGIAVSVGGRIEAFAMGSSINQKTFGAHFLKADVNCPGLFQYTLRALARSIPVPYEYLNQEQDLGIPGLRTAKERWCPVALIEKYSAA